MSEYKKKLIVLSGIPGCGKSTFTEKLCGTGEPIVAFSTDEFFVGDDGAYNFKPHLLGEAHAWNYGRFIDQIANGDNSTIVIDNTNIQEWERNNYFALANLHGYKCELHCWVTASISQLSACVDRNSHGVPAEVISRMALNHDTRAPDYVKVVVHSIQQ